MENTANPGIPESFERNRYTYRGTRRDNNLRPKRPKTMRVKTVLILLLFGIAITTLFFGFLYQRGKRLMDDETASITSPPGILYSIYEGKNIFSRPISITVTDDGTIHVANNNLNTVEVISATGKGLRSYGKAGTAQGQFLYPYGIGALPNGHILVAETGNFRIQELSPKGQFIQTFIPKNNKIGLQKPGPLYIDSKGHVYIGDLAAHQVIVVDKNRNVIRRFKGIKYPHGIAVDEKLNRLYVADSGKVGVKVFDLGKKDENPYKVIQTWKPNTRFTMVRGLATDKHGRLFVVDTISCAVRVFDKNGEYLFSFGQQGFKDGEFLYPSGIFTDSAGKIYVADWGNDRVQVWGY